MLAGSHQGFVAAGNATKLYPALDLKEVGEEVVAVAETLDPLVDLESSLKISRV